MTHLRSTLSPIWWGCLPLSVSGWLEQPPDTPWNSVSLAPEHMSLTALVPWTQLCPPATARPGHQAVQREECVLPCRCAAGLSACRRSRRLHGHLQARPGYRVPVLGSDVPTVWLCSSCRWRPEGRNEGGLSALEAQAVQTGQCCAPGQRAGQCGPGPPRPEGARQDPRARSRDGRGRASLHNRCTLAWTFLLMLTEACSVTRKCILLSVQIRQLRPEGTQTEDGCGGLPPGLCSPRASQRGPRSKGRAEAWLFLTS